MRVLVVEDEVKMAGLLKRGLEEEGYAVDMSGTGQDALWLAAENPYDAVILDIMLPDLDGFEVCRRLRAAGRWSPVLMLTARDAVPDRVSGLDAGADDYLTKPFSFAELLARLRALVRRGATERPPFLAVGDLTLDPATRSRDPGRDPRGAHRQGVRIARMLHAAPRRGPFPHPAHRARVGLRLRGRLQRGGRLRPVPAGEGRSPLRFGLPRDRPGSRLPLQGGAGRCGYRSGLGSRSSRRPSWPWSSPSPERSCTCGFRPSCWRSWTRVSVPGAEALLTSLRQSPEALGEGGGLIDPGDAFAQLLGPGAVVIQSSPGLRTAPLLTGAEVAGLRGPRFLERDAQTVDEAVQARLLAVRAPEERVLVVGASLDDQHEALARLATLMAIGGPLALILAGGVGWVVAGAALRPVERMRVEAAAISASEPGRRLLPAGTGDEVARLGETLNEMLDRLEQALQRERRFVDEASHELRTPLANLRVELELALRRSRSTEELEAALRSAAEETERLARLAEDLLVLARADRGRVPVRREEVEMAELVGGQVEAFAARAAKAGVSVEARVPPGLRASLDPLRMRQAVGNLLDNALRHTPPHGTVTVEVAHADGFLVLEVRDTGKGFPAAFLPSAFEPFARPDASRSRPDSDRDGGGGLGLAIVRAVAEAHGGAAEAGNRPGGGGSVTLRIPD